METLENDRKLAFQNRKEAGKELAILLRTYKNSNSQILALPRGGVPVAAEISHVLDIPMEVLAVRKIGVPLFSEVAAGAICEEDPPYFSENLMMQLGLSPDDLDYVVERETIAVKRQINLFRSGRDLPTLTKKNIILVDDGLATGATMLAAAKFLKKKNVAKIIAAFPVGPKSSIKSISEVVDEVVCPLQPDEFISVSQYYNDFAQIRDDQVIALCNSHRFKGISSNPVENSLEKIMRPFKKLGDLNSLIEAIKDTRVVMLGEASHGTHEYYQLRATISKRLIEDHGFKFIAVEGDWPDAYRLHRYIHDQQGRSSVEVLRQNHRWPTWMWANEEVAKFAEWLRFREVGFFGLDVYSLFESIDEIITILEKYDVEFARQIRTHYSCFDPFERDELSYSRSLSQFPKGCEKEVLDSLKKLLQVRLQNSEEIFNVQQNARIIKNAESYYRAMSQGDDNSWNVRDSHMLETLDLLLEHYGEGSKGIVWAHNTHIGDYRATDMKKHGYVNLGGLAREKYGAENVKLVGFGSYQGQVLAGNYWGDTERIMPLPAGRENSFEWHCHQLSLKKNLNRFFFDFTQNRDSILDKSLLHRAVGVVYNPDQEYRGNYVPSEMTKRYDQFIFIDRTHALKSLHSYANEKSFPETWPFGE